MIFRWLAVNKATRLNVNLSFGIIPITFDALLIMFSIWQCHCPLLLNVRPKCLCSVTNFMGVPSKNMLGRDSINFKVKGITSVFKGLKFINHCAAQLTSMRKSLLIIPSMSLIVAAKKRNILLEGKVCLIFLLVSLVGNQLWLWLFLYIFYLW